MKFFFFPIFALLVLLPKLSFGAGIDQSEFYKYYPYLKNFNINNFKTCSALIEKNCAPTDPSAARYTYKASCLNNVYNSNYVCDQSVKLSKIFGWPVTDFTIKEIKNFYIISLFFMDGVDSYSILTPAGYLLHTSNVDLQKLLANKYKNSFFPINWGEIKSQSCNDTCSFIVTLRITKSCLGCEIIGYAKIRFVFDKNGMLIKTRLLHFGNKAN